MADSRSRQIVGYYTEADEDASGEEADRILVFFLHDPHPSISECYLVAVAIEARRTQWKEGKE